MNKNTIRNISIALLGLSLGLWSSVIIPSFVTKQKQSSQPPEPTWQEQPRTLSDIEHATMSANFTTDFEKNMALANTTPEPTPLFLRDIPASMAGDLQPPTLTIQGSIADNAIISFTNPCFPLWVTDNMTPWQRLQTRTKLDTQSWSTWAEAFSYCFQNLTTGTHIFSVQIRDLAGNVSPEIQRPFIVQTP